MGSAAKHIQEPLTVTLEANPLDCWAEESTASALRPLAVRLHSSGLSFRETAAALELFGVTRSHQAVFQWVHRVAEEAPDPPAFTRARVVCVTFEHLDAETGIHGMTKGSLRAWNVQRLTPITPAPVQPIKTCRILRTVKPPRVAVDEPTVTIDTERHWLYAAIDVETKLLLDVWISPRCGTDSAAAFLGRLAEKHDLSEATLLIDGMGYLTALAWCYLRGHLDYVDRNLIEKWFQTLAMRIDRFHQTWIGRRASVQRWLTAFVHYYNRQQPNQALENRTPAE